MAKTYEILNSIIEGEHCLEVCQFFLDVNAGDETTQSIILSIFCKLFDCSQDLLVEAINEYHR